MKLKKATLIAFLVVQGVVPVWALVTPTHAMRTDFTWDMFAVRRDCSPCQLYYTIGDGEPERLSWGLRSPPLRIDSPPGIYRGLTTRPTEQDGDVEFRGLFDTLWNAPELHGPSIVERAEFDSLGVGTILVYPGDGNAAGRFALNVRAAPQVARLKSTRRLEMVGRTACAELEDVLEAARADPSANRWVRHVADRWERAGRTLTVHGVCECSYNGSPAIPLIEEGSDLCAQEGR